MSSIMNTIGKKVALSVRINPLASQLLTLEYEGGKGDDGKPLESEGDIVSRCLIHCLSVQPGARELVSEYIAKDPTLGTLFKAFAGGAIKTKRPKQKNSKQEAREMIEDAQHYDEQQHSKPKRGKR